MMIDKFISASWILCILLVAVGCNRGSPVEPVSPDYVNRAWTWGGADNDSCDEVAIDGSGNIYVCGIFKMVVDFDPGDDIEVRDALLDNDNYLSKFNPSGEFQWVRTWGNRTTHAGTAGCELALDSFDNVYVFGRFCETLDFDPGPDEDIRTPIGSSDFYLSKFDSIGEFIWVKTWGGGIAQATDLNIDHLGNIILVGGYNHTVDFDPSELNEDRSANGAGDAFVSMFNLDGEFQWVRTWGGAHPNSWDNALGCTIDNDGNVYVSGYFRDDTDFGPGIGVIEQDGSGHSLSKLDSNGNNIWVRTWDNGWRGYGVKARENGNILIAGSVRDGADVNPGEGTDIRYTNGYSDAGILELTSEGEFVQAIIWGGEYDDLILDLAIDGIGGIYARGGFRGTMDFDPGQGVVETISNGESDAYLSKFDHQGVLQWVRTWGGEGGDSAKGISIGDNATVLITGTYQGIIDFGPGSEVEFHNCMGERDCFLIWFGLDGS